MKKIILLFCILAFDQVVRGQSGMPDPSFGGNGSILTPPPAAAGNASFSIARQCFIDADGKISLVLQATKTMISRRLSNGSLDASYGHNGFSVVVSMIVTAAAEQADGKIVVAGTRNGSSDFMLARYNDDGELDPLFGNNGVTITDLGSAFDFLAAVVITPDNKIIVGGFTNLNGNNQSILIRYTSAGIVDATFGNNGIVTTAFDIKSLALQPDGKIITAGTAFNDFALERYNADGTPDLSFNSTGRTIINLGFFDRCMSVVVNNEGKIYAGGYSTDASGYQHFGIARFNEDGSADAGFNTGTGFVLAVFGNSYDILTNLRLQSDGKVIASGHTTSDQSNFDIELIRINTDGTIDSSFGNNGNGLVLGDINSKNDESDFLTIQPDDKIVTGGVSQDFTNASFSCFRYNSDGTPDTEFGVGGNFTDFFPGSFCNYSALFQQADGKLLATSETFDGINTKQFINRFNANGTPDNSYGQNGTHEMDLFYGLPIFQPDGKLLRIGSSTTNNGDIMLLRYNSDGTPDAGFGNGGTAITDFGGTESPNAVGFQPDGKIIIGGLWRDDNGSDLLVVRYNPDGSVDGSFGNGGYVRMDFENEDVVQSIAIAPDGKIVFGGSGILFPPDFSSIDFDALIVRLNPDGSIDTGFGYQGKTMIDRSNNDAMGFLQVQNDNKILFSYYASLDGSNQSTFIERLNPDGSADDNFGQNGKTACDAALMLLQADQKILIVGNKINNQNNTDFTLARFNTDGNPDPSFGTNGKTILSFTHLDNFLYTAFLSGNSLFAGGNGMDDTGTSVGIIAKFQLESPRNVSCPADQIVNTDTNLCAARVYNIDPAVTPGDATVTYELTGATSGTGNSSVSGKLFNKGITTVTYILSGEITKSCNFMITVQDNELPTVDNLIVSQITLWPADHKLKDITISYSENDNCGIANTQVSVTSNEPVQTGERGDLSPDWQILDNHHIRLRAERLESGNGRIYSIEVTTTDVSGNQNAATAIVTVPKSMGNTGPNLIMTVAPNPSNSYFQVTINSGSRDKINVRLLNNKGAIISTISNVNDGQTLKIGDELVAGIYFLEVTQSGVTKTVELVKQ